MEDTVSIFLSSLIFKHSPCIQSLTSAMSTTRLPPILDVPNERKAELQFLLRKLEQDQITTNHLKRTITEATAKIYHHIAYEIEAMDVSLKQILRVQGHLPGLDFGRHEGVRFARARTLATLKELMQDSEVMQRRLEK
jgi:hypothetical protein